MHKLANVRRIIPSSHLPFLVLSTWHEKDMGAVCYGPGYLYPNVDIKAYHVMKDYHGGIQIKEVVRVNTNPCTLLSLLVFMFISQQGEVRHNPFAFREGGRGRSATYHFFISFCMLIFLSSWVYDIIKLRYSYFSVIPDFMLCVVAVCYYLFIICHCREGLSPQRPIVFVIVFSKAELHFVF